MKIEFRDIKAPTDNEKCVLAIDGATSNTGMSVLTLNTGELRLMGHFRRSETYESPVRYKILLKEQIHILLKNNRNITDIVYEEPVIDNVSSVRNLFMLRSMVEELLIENEEELSYITYKEVSNMKWKKIFLYPLRVPNNKDKAKVLIAQKFDEEQPMLRHVTQDEKDSYGLGKAYTQTRNKKELESRKALRQFKYNTYISGISSTDDVMDLIEREHIKVPNKVLENGIEIIETTGRKNFDKQVLECMGADDKLLLFIYNSNKLGSLLLRFKLGDLIKTNERIGIFVWRTNRKHKVKYRI